MTMDANGNSHEPAGTPRGGQFARKAGMMDDSDLGNEAGPVPECVRNREEGCAYATEDEMARFRAALPVRPVVMGDRGWGEAAAVRATDDGYAVDLYSGMHPATALVSLDGYDSRERAEQGARDALASPDDVLHRFQTECLEWFDGLYGDKRTDDDTVTVYAGDDGRVDVQFDEDRAIVLAYDGDNRPTWNDCAELRDGESVDKYLDHIREAAGIYPTRRRR